MSRIHILGAGEITARRHRAIENMQDHLGECREWLMKAAVEASKANLDDLNKKYVYCCAQLSAEIESLKKL